VFFVLSGLLITLLSIDDIYLNAILKTFIFTLASFVFVIYGGASKELQAELKRIINKILKNEKD